MIPDHILDQIRQNNDVVDVIGSYFPLKRAGANFRALCPFHKEKTPSFNVNPTKQIWHCFGCGVGGDVFTFVMKYESLDFMSAVRRLAERAGIKLEMEEAGVGPTRGEKDSLLKLHDDVAAWFQQLLLKDKSAEVARRYLEKRKISLATVKKWRIGYAPEAWDGLLQWAQAKQYPAALLETAGLVVRGERDVYDRFRGRLMFSIGDEQGRVVAFSGRILTEAKDQPKYVNSPETPIFQKGKILFALDKARRAIADEGHAIVCEGQIDTISCHEAGVENVVAPQGTALTEQHARVLKRYADEVVLMFDADAAGQNAAVRGAEALLEAGLVVRVAILPQGHDPDSLVKEKGATELKKLVTEAGGVFVYLLERLSREYDTRTERGKLLVAQQMVEWIARIPSPVLASTHIQQTAARLDVPEEAIRGELRKRRGPKRPERVATEEIAIEPDRPALAAEERLLELMLSDERMLTLTAEQADRAWLTDSLAGQLIEKALDLYNSNRWAGPSSLMNASQTEDATKLVSRLMLTAHRDAQAEAAGDCLRALERLWVERQWKDLRKQLAQPSLPRMEMIKLQERVLDLRRRLDNIAPLRMEKNQSPVR